MNQEALHRVPSIQPLCEFLGKDPADFHKADLVRYCAAKQIRRLILRYIALDGRIRELICPISDENYLYKLLAFGERVDGSSLFPGLFAHTSSDLYVVPVYETAFQDPFDPAALSVICRFFGKDGLPARETPEEALRSAFERLKAATGFELWAMGEMEYYLILDKKDDRFTGLTQRNYHQSSPFSHGGAILRDVIDKLSAISGAVKYGHGEVGYLDCIESQDPELDGKRVEQQEVELLPRPAPAAAVLTTLATWTIRNCANLAGASATFAPKLDPRLAGSGMHLHLALVRNGINVMDDGAGGLSDVAVKMIGGLLKHADLLVALGNTVASSFLRLGSGMETPMSVCWSAYNREAMIRVPLGWQGAESMEHAANPFEPLPAPMSEPRQTVELRSPDASAFTFLLLTAICRAAEDGLTGPDSTALAMKLRVTPDGNPGTRNDSGLPKLPTCCADGAAALSKNRSFLEDGGVVCPALIDHAVRKLESERDRELPEELSRLPRKQRELLTRRIMHKDLHKH
ncbi:MAG: glutamine synthetase [bacterium]